MRHLKILLAISSVLVLMSCENEDQTYDNYQSALGYVDTTIISDYQYGIKLDQDSNPMLIPIMIDDSYYTAKHGDRVFVSYSLIESNELDSPEAEVLIHTITSITVKEIVPFNIEEESNYGNEPSYMENKSLWQTDQLLNAHIGYMGNGFGKHTVTLVAPESLEQDQSGNYILDVYHNDNGFKGTNYFEGIISFDLTSLDHIIPEAELGISFVIRYNKGMGSEKTLSKVFSYPNSTSSEIFECHYESTINIE